MDPYTEKTSCPKCASPLIGTSWVSAGDDRKGGSLQRKCCRCGYFWNEMPLDEAERREAQGR